MVQTTTAGAAACVSTTPSAPYAEIRETHTGVVVLIDDRAYKIKKPVTTDFLDYSLLASRERACARARLNSTAALHPTAIGGSLT